MGNKIFPKKERKCERQYGRQRYKNLLEHEKKGWLSIEKSIMKFIEIKFHAIDFQTTSEIFF